VSDLLPIAAALLAAGGLIGVLAGLFGVGGGAISVPVLFEAFGRMGTPEDVAMPLAVGTSLAMIVPTGISSARAHARRGAVDRAVLATWALPILAGVTAGAAIARVAPAELFQAIFAGVAALLALRMLAGVTFRAGRQGIGRGWRARSYGAAIGLLSSLMGIGGGAISNLILTSHGASVKRAVATSAAVGVLIAVPGAIGYGLAGLGTGGLPGHAVGFVSLLGVALTMPTALLCAPLGARLAHALPDRLLGRLFGAFLLAVSARFFYALLG